MIDTRENDGVRPEPEHIGMEADKLMREPGSPRSIPDAKDKDMIDMVICRVPREYKTSRPQRTGKISQFRRRTPIPKNTP